MSDRSPHVTPTLNASGSLSPEYFEQLYIQSADPWEFATSPYEAAKYAATLAALPRRKYTSGLELGCSIGVLTRQLAPRCTELLAIDVSATALREARERCADLPHATFDNRDLTNDFPTGVFDLVLVSEIGYYFSKADLELLRRKIANSLMPGGHLLLVHYTGRTNYPLTADAVHETFLAWDGKVWTHAPGRGADGYRLDLFIKTTVIQMERG